MSFDVYLDGTEKNTKESSLFSGYDGRLQLAGINGSLSLNRDYFNQSFEYQVEKNKKHRITVVGTIQSLLQGGWTRSSPVHTGRRASER